MRHVFPNSESHINQKLFIYVQQQNIKDVIFSFKNMYGFRKHRPYLDMANNYVLLSLFQKTCWLVYFVVDFIYLVITIMFQIL